MTTSVTTLETERLSGDLIEVFKIMNVLMMLTPVTSLFYQGNILGSHALKMFKNVSKFNFFNRVVDHVWKFGTE